jgi:predicted nucleic-acid-binding Zn-ribbon protein
MKWILDCKNCGHKTPTTTPTVAVFIGQCEKCGYSDYAKPVKDERNRD